MKKHRSTEANHPFDENCPSCGGTGLLTDPANAFEVPDTEDHTSPTENPGES